MEDSSLVDVINRVPAPALTSKLYFEMALNCKTLKNVVELYFKMRRRPCKVGIKYF